MKPTQRGKPDFFLLFLTFCLVGFGLVMVFSSSSAVSVYKHGTPWVFTQKQALFAIVGMVAMFFFMNINVRVLKKSAFLLLLLSFILLILVLVIGDEIKGAKRWFGIAGFGIQPIEFVKLAVIIYLASFISRKEERLRDFRTGILPIMIVISLICLLLLLQPDYGSMLILLAIVAIMMFIGGIRFKHLLTAGIIVVPICVLLIWTQNYRLSRFTAFLNPWDDPLGSGFQLIQSLFAFGHGGIHGAGFGQSIQKLHYLPEAHTDFIFPIIAEEFGLIGSAIFIFAYLLFIVRGWSVAIKSKDLFQILLGTGIVTMIAIQALINMGGVTGTIPISGVTLPLISYGGSSLLVSMSAVGILLSISRGNQRSPQVERRDE